MKNKKIISGIIAVALAILLVSVYILLPDNDKIAKSVELGKYLNTFTYSSEGLSYDTYLSNCEEIADISEEKIIDLGLTAKKGTKLSFDVILEKSLASIELVYKVISENNNDAECKIEINDEQPFQEAASIMLPRSWKVASVESDDRGNLYSAELQQGEEWITYSLYDSTGYHNSPLKFAFDSGVNTITVLSEKCDILIKNIKFYNFAEAPAYNEVSSQYKNFRPAEETITVEAEYPASRSDTSIKELCDRTTPATQPPLTDIRYGMR